MTSVFTPARRKRRGLDHCRRGRHRSGHDGDEDNDEYDDNDDEQPSTSKRPRLVARGGYQHRTEIEHASKRASTTCSVTPLMQEMLEVAQERMMLHTEQDSDELQQQGQQEHQQHREDLARSAATCAAMRLDRVLDRVLDLKLYADVAIYKGLGTKKRLDETGGWQRVLNAAMLARLPGDVIERTRERVGRVYGWVFEPVHDRPRLDRPTATKKIMTEAEADAAAEGHGPCPIEGCTYSACGSKGKCSTVERHKRFLSMHLQRGHKKAPRQACSVCGPQEVRVDFPPFDEPEFRPRGRKAKEEEEDEEEEEG